MPRDTDLGLLLFRQIADLCHVLSTENLHRRGTHHLVNPRAT